MDTRTLKRVIAGLVAALMTLATAIESLPGTPGIADIPLLAWVYALIAGLGGVYVPTERKEVPGAIQ